MQRLFSTFPSSWPGVGLLLLRACLALALFYFGISDLWSSSQSTVLVQDLIAAAGGVFLLAGLWTPAMGAVVSLDEVWSALYSPSREGVWVRVFLAVFAISIAMLGPGAWSVDARLFGRKRFDIDRTRIRKHPSN